MKHFKTAIKILLKADTGVHLIIETPVNREYGVGGTIRDLNELYESSKKRLNSVLIHNIFLHLDLI